MSRPGERRVDWGFTLSVPDTWFTPGLHEPDAIDHDVVEDAIDLLVARFPSFAPARERMAAAAGNVLAHAVDNDALSVSVGFDVVHDDVVAMSLAAYGMFGGGVPDVARLAEVLRRPRREDLMGREVTVVELPAGPAVRVHAITEAAPEPDGSVMVVEGVDHFVPVPGHEDMLMITCTTPSVGVGDVLLPLFDEIVATLRFTSAR